MQNDTLSLSGITDEDVQQIQAQIAEIIHKNQMGLPDAHKTIVHKNELAFPLIINGLVLVISALIIAGIAYLVSKEEADMADTGSAFASVEGQLIRQLRQDADLQLSEKDRELAEIRTQLDQLEREQRRALKIFETQYLDRESEFQRLLDQDVAAERQRLIALEISEEKIDEFLESYEKARFIYYQGELAAYRGQLDTERRLTEENYQTLHNQYQNNIKSLNAERQIIQEELRQREQEIRIVQETQGNRSQQTGLELEQAQTALFSLEAQRQRLQLEEHRITGMFNQVRNALQQERYLDAISQSEILIQYLEEMGQMYQENQQRRILDIYLASALTQLARTELNRTMERTAENRYTEEWTAEINTLRARVDALEQENIRITQLHTESEIANRSRLSQLEAENLRLSLLNQTNQPTASIEDQRRRYEAELANLTGRIARLETENTRLAMTNEDLLQGAALQERQRQADSTAANFRITQLEGENVQLNRLYQEASQAADQNRRIAGQLTTMTSRIPQLEEENLRLSRLLQDLAQVSAQNRHYEAELSGLTSRIAQLERENAHLNESHNALSQDSRQNETELSGLTSRIAQLEQENAHLNEAYHGLFQDSQQNETELSGLLRRNTQLEQAISQLNQTQDAMIKAGHKEGVANVMNILDTSLRVQDQEIRRKYLENMKPRYFGEPDIIAIIDLLISRL
ncbi:MAG: hypothetical protein LBD29_10145 [Treponema sp.]|nr:hypothetical protein [Treponema sp.]